MILKNKLLSLIILLILLSSNIVWSIPKISIITSVFNGDEFIEGFLSDITRQTIFNQCELIMINAASPGNEEPIIKKYMEQYPNIIYKKLDKDPGLYGTWNIAISLSSGSYITNANLDDRLAPNCYEIHASALDANPEIMLVYSDRFYTCIPNETFEKHSGNKFPAYPQWSKEIMYECWPCNNPMWRRTMHEKYGLFDISYRHSGDWEMWLRAIEGGALCKKIDGYYALYFYNTQGLSTGQQYKKLKDQEDEKIRERYGYMWGRHTFAEYYALAQSIEKNGNGKYSNWAQAMNYYLKAYSLNPRRAEPLVHIALHYYLVRNNVLAYLFANRACEISIPNDCDIEQELYLFTRYDLLAISAWYMGEFVKGEQAAQKALEYHPDDQRLQANLKSYKDRIKN